MSRSSCGTHLRVDLLSPSARWRNAFTVEREILKCLDICFARAKGCLSRDVSTLGICLGTCMSEVRQNTIDRRSRTWKVHSSSARIFVSSSFDGKTFQNTSLLKWVHDWALTSGPQTHRRVLSIFSPRWLILEFKYENLHNLDAKCTDRRSIACSDL
jgi:hypothetical protein